ncbi:16S rRNA (cytidine(1402)-2'-O)-methyltransferase [Syntrophomonas palmitatica]|uniref:16S rRNA (cytidine(1402)-2'-O)-methyltransferase n=1 Tax=Syntrophomonas palmitatica TaxID=402877 RepID=UPI0006D1F4DF|nr:16S rRNA (cytidine(1402)-2'-O)-methyltransferase [Syntrophomonas palmitatica]
MSEAPGKLYVCATPIGNLEDVSIRLLKTLRRADLIACEDTRHSLKLLNHYKIKKPLISYHQHSGKVREDRIVKELMAGRNVALVSDAGMPGISDPGQGLVQKAIAAGIQVEVIPGPSALICALSISGMNTDAFVFAGFLSAKRTQRREQLQSLAQDKRTVVIYEAPHRLPHTLEDIEEIMGAQRPMAMMRELTKLHEEVVRGAVGELRQRYAQNTVRGEICLVIAGLQDEKTAAASLETIAAETRKLIEDGMDKKEAFKLKAREYKVAKSIIYKYYVENYDH